MKAPRGAKQGAPLLVMGRFIGALASAGALLAVAVGQGRNLATGNRVYFIGRGHQEGLTMTYAEPLLWRSAPSHLHPARMYLSPDQHSRIAATYDTAAFDTSSTPYQGGLC